MILIYRFPLNCTGKTMLMDMFYKSTECVVKHRRRFHFHEVIFHYLKKKRFRYCIIYIDFGKLFLVSCNVLQAMLEIHEHMHDVWKNRVEENSFQSNIYNWISNLPFDSKVKEWLIGEEKYKQETQMKHILPTVADRFLLGKKSDQRGATILCFDEIQVYSKHFHWCIDLVLVADRIILTFSLQTIDVFAVVALSGILSRLLSTGTVLVATSNRLPEDLNQVNCFVDLNLVKIFRNQISWINCVLKK